MTARAAVERLHVAPADIGIATAGSAAAALAGYVLVKGSTSLAVAVCALPAIALLLHKPTVMLVLLGASLPATQSLPGMPASYNAAISDVLMVLILAALLARWATTGRASELRALRPMSGPILPYCAVLVALLAVHAGVAGAAQTIQRLELFVVPMIVGVFAVRSGKHIVLLKAYVVATTVLALTWPLGILFDGQKNPVGQFIGNAILLLVGVPASRRFFPLLVILVPALFVTQSRGAILATAIGVALLMLMQGLERSSPADANRPARHHRLRSRSRFMPAETRVPRDHVLGRNGHARRVRDQDPAGSRRRRSHSHRPSSVDGRGDRQLRGGRRREPPPAVEDPHQILLLEAVEGGYLLAGAFVLMILGGMLVLVRDRRHPLAPAAAGVFAATALHGLVDIYWVRGTPVLGWLLSGWSARRASAKARRRNDGVTRRVHVIVVAYGAAAAPRRAASTPSVSRSRDRRRQLELRQQSRRSQQHARHVHRPG